LAKFLRSFKEWGSTKSSLQDDVSNSDGMEVGGFLKLIAKIDVSTCTA
jgi:hypothetical protein